MNYIKTRIALAMPLLIVASILAFAALSQTGCVHTPVVTNGVTNIVTTIDPVKLDQVKAAVEPAAASVLRRAILNSPQHSAEIGNYGRAVGQALCKAVAKQSITPAAILAAIDVATQGLQSNVPPEVIDGKNAALALYRILWDDKLTILLPDNQWPNAVLSVFCDSIDLALKDAGQLGVK